MVAETGIFYQLFECSPDGIVVVDGDGQITQVNATAERMFGFTRDELTGKSVEVLVPERFATRHVDHRNKYRSDRHMRPMGADLDLHARRKDGSEFPVAIMLSPLESETHPMVLAVVRDITEQKRIERQVQEAMRRELALKEVHRKEIHHRVKNNLQVISSLLFLKSTMVDDPAMLEVLTQSQSQIKTIALIHEKLYRSDDVERMDFAEYVRDLVADVMRTYVGRHDGVTVHVDIDAVRVGVDTAIPCGLIINELVSNVLKHAFAPGTTGDFWVGLRQGDDGRYELSIRDNGRGFPPGFDWHESKSLGLKLVADLARQLNGELDVSNSNAGGAAFQVTFTEAHYPERG